MTPTTPEAKTVAHSRAEQVHIIMPVDVNGGYTLFGGMLMQWIDVVAGVVSRRHSETETRTAAIDHLEFLAPAHINDTVTIAGRVTCVGNTSMEVCVDTYVERLGSPGRRMHVNRAYLTMVAIGLDGRPTRVPRLIAQTDEEKADYEAGLKRRERRRQAALD
ncbi:MAG TPA: acyl-CoA thioesterase [Candidatus Limiplasma stercoravium]|nr:acyl-CoA thioesterase [Candidatus Limiplasma stercoravium]